MKKTITQQVICSFLFFSFFFLNTHLVSAQIVLDTLNSNNGKKTLSCPTNQSFTDDNKNDGLYFDGKARRDTIVLCPNSNNYQIKVTFSSFSVASGDELRVYDCDLTKTSCAVSQTASGDGVSRAFGGWVQASCDPAVNATGCLSFEFITNGDNAKGTGWNASVTCENNAVSVHCPATVTAVDDCNNLDGMVTVTIPKPTFSACGGASNAMVNITSNCSAIPSMTVLADGGTYGTFTIPLGTYTITATSVSDNSKKCSYLVVGDQPTITCNGNVSSTIGLNCSASITVDDILEGPCVGPATTYKMEIDLGNKGKKASVTVDGSSHSALANGRLEIPSSDFTCGSEYPVTVTRIVSFTSCGSQSSVSSSCTGRIRFVDNTAPFISVTSQTLTTCGELTDAEIKSKLSITVTDNCDVKDTTFSVGAIPSDFCGSNLSIPITVTAVDHCGNSNTETFNVSIKRPTTFYAPRDTVLPCGSGTSPSVTGYPVLDTNGDNVGDLPIKENTCNFISTYTDQVVTANNSSTRKIFRTWQVTDWCKKTSPITLKVQTIEIKGTGKLGINCPSGSQRGTKDNPHTFSTNTFNCNASVNIAPPSGSDQCGSSISVVFLRAINIDDKKEYNSLSSSFSVGKYYAEYYATDGSSNRSDTCKVYFDVRDGGAPSAVCIDELNVSFVNGQAKILISNIDIGSTDNCTSISKEIRKEGGTWGQEVIISCEEVNNNVKIQLRVTDQNGGSNTCWTAIKGKDTSVPDCQQLENKTIACTNFHSADFGPSTDANDNKDFDSGEWQPLTGALLSTYNSQFGNPDCANNSACSSASLEQEYQYITARCGGVIIKRRYRAVNDNAAQSAWKEQEITLTVEQDFSIAFPADWEGNCGDNFPEANLTINSNGCNILGWTHEDKQFNGVNGACFIIERTYSVTNWCEYQVGDAAQTIARVEDEHGVVSQGQTVNASSHANVGLFEYVQVLRVTDNTAPTLTAATVETCINQANCQEAKVFSIDATDCLGKEGLSYEYELISAGQSIEKGTGDSFTATVNPQSYEVKWTVNDNCGNTATESFNYTFKDCKKPSPFCIDGLSIGIDTEIKAGTIWASDLDQKSNDNCSAADKLAFRVWHPSLQDSINKPAATATGAMILDLPKSVALNCDYIGSQNVEFYVVDEAGNWDFCLASVFIQDANGTCGNAILDTNNVAKLSGGIFTPDNTPLKSVNLIARGTAAYEKSISTNASGIFELDLPKGIGYSISIQKEDEADNGISVFDILLVTKHILGTSPFNSPYQYIAADVNRSGSVTTFDVVQMRKIILGVETDISNTDNWRFVRADHGFNPDNPDDFEFTETIIIPIFNDAISELDIIGVKVGDLNGSVKTDGLRSTEPRNAHTATLLHLKDQSVKQGELVNVALQLNPSHQLEGLQYALAYEGLELGPIKEGLIKEKHINKKEKGVLSVCWHEVDATKKDNNLLQLSFIAQKDGQLSEMIHLANNFTTEAVDQEENIMDVQLNFTKTAVNQSFKLYQNSPNPFTATTKIAFQLMEEENISLEIFNLQGKLLKQIKGNYAKGYNEVRVDKADLDGNGVLIYQLKTKHGIASKKMILLD